MAARSSGVILIRSNAILLVGFAVLAGCATPQVIAPLGSAQDRHRQMNALSRLDRHHAIMADGYRLPLRVWSGSTEPSIVLLGLHGFNDYSHAFAPLASDLARRGIVTYAADQRGFGASALPGRWHGDQALTEDLRTLIALLRARHPRARLYVAGESMGGAVAMLAAARRPLPIDGLILVAPAVWSRDTMPWYQRAALRAAMQTLPWLKLTGEGVRLSPSDNREMLLAMSRDPLAIKATRVDALWGVTDLMDGARASAAQVPTPLLLLYGEHDEIIPRKAFCRLLGTLPRDRDGLRLALYRRGWHMLPRDRQGARVRADIAAWLGDPTAPLPSGEETPLDGDRAQALCAGLD